MYRDNFTFVFTLSDLNSRLQANFLDALSEKENLETPSFKSATPEHLRLPELEINSTEQTLP
jgi:hypothetical protein